MAKLVIFNKPWGVLCQFKSTSPDVRTLADFVPVKGVYPAGRLDKDSEGMVLLTDSGALQTRISHPDQKMEKTYWVQVEGIPDERALEALRSGVSLRDKGGKNWKTRRAKVSPLPSAPLPERQPPVRKRLHIPTCWLEMRLQEGKNRQVRRMTAAVGHPCLRLFRQRIGHWQMESLAPGEYRVQQVNLPENER